MKMKLHLTALLCLFICSAFAQDPNWMALAKARIDEHQHAFKMLAPGRFGAVSPAQNSSYNIRRDAYEVKSIKGDYDLTVSISSVLGKSPKRVFINERNQLSYQYDDLTVQYENSSRGLRQNFILERKRPEPLQLEFKTGLLSNIAESYIQFKDINHNLVFAYDELKVFDADGKILASRFIDHGNNRIAIEIDDHQARYPITIDPLNHMPSWTDSGDGLLFPLLSDGTLHTLYGFSVSKAGRLNNDLYDDIVIGAPAFVDIVNIQNGTFNVATVGAAFVYFGSATGPSTDPDEVLQPTTQAGALFGFSVASAGDLNHDGYDDLVIGAPGDHVNLTVLGGTVSVAVGKVYVYYGGGFDGNVNTEPTVSVTISLKQSDFGTLLTVPVNPLFGFSVAGLGHTDANNFDNIAIGAPAFVSSLLRTGRVDVYDGNDLTVPQQTYTGSILNGLFGFSVSAAGNVNGDNYQDMIVGAPGDLTLLGLGNAYIFHGKNNGMTGVQATLTSGGLTSTLFGFSVTDAGDLNKDGYGDVAVGEPASLEPFASSLVAVGAVKIYYGSSSGINLASKQSIYSPRRPSVLGLLSGNLLFGYSVSAAGDVDCDGYPDLIVGEPGGTALSLLNGLLGIVSVNALSGNAYVFNGTSAGLMSIPFFTVSETASVSVANLIGYSVSEAGDVNHDGHADILIGAPNGTLNLSTSIVPLVGDLLNFITVNSIGSAFTFNGCLASANAPLPVTLSNFEARALKTSVLLSWKTDTEIDTRYYEVERSRDGQPYSTIGRVLAQGSGNSYSFSDEKPGSKNLYRLKMVDNDGSFTYSPVKSVEFDPNQQILVYPNPAKTDIRIRIYQNNTGVTDVKLINQSGAVVWRKTVTNTTTGTEITVPRNNLPAGQYILIANDIRKKIQWMD